MKKSELDNTAYLEALINNDAKIIRKIYDDIFPIVRNFILNNKGNQEHAEDIFQKGLMQLMIRYRKEPFIINTTFKAYFTRVCKNLWFRELNTSKVRVTNDDFFEPKSEEEDFVLAILEQERWELFSEMFEKLSENCREVLTHYLKKLSYKEIKMKMDYQSETVVRQRVFKCKNKLKELITKDKRFNTLKEL